MAGNAERRRKRLHERRAEAARRRGPRRKITLPDLSPPRAFSRLGAAASFLLLAFGDLLVRTNSAPRTTWLEPLSHHPPVQLGSVHDQRLFSVVFPCIMLVGALVPWARARRWTPPPLFALCVAGLVLLRLYALDAVHIPAATVLLRGLLLLRITLALRDALRAEWDRWRERVQAELRRGASAESTLTPKADSQSEGTPESTECRHRTTS